MALHYPPTSEKIPRQPCDAVMSCVFSDARLVGAGEGEREGSLYSGAQASDVIPDNPYPVIPCSIPHDK